MPDPQPLATGVTTEHLDRLAHDYIVDVQKAIPANVGYRGFPKTVCTSVNHVICHGIPTESKVLKDGDIVNIDVTVIKDAIADYSDEAMHAALVVNIPNYASAIVSTAEIVDSLAALRDA